MSETTKEDPNMCVLKTATCKSVTGNSLGYQLGVLPDSTIHIRITKNSGAGFFNTSWVAIKDIQKALAERPNGQPLTSFMLQPLIEGRSSNTPAFLMMALTQEKLLRVLKGKKRGHEFLDPEGFNARMDKLVASKAKSEGTAGSTVKKAPRKKAAIKKKATSRRKTATST